jgi:hypothetical protein
MQKTVVSLQINSRQTSFCVCILSKNVQSIRVRSIQRFMETRAPFRDGSRMVYVGVCVGGRTDLYVCRRTMTENMYGNDIVDNILPQFQAAIRKNFVYVDDNARPHRTQ